VLNVLVISDNKLDLRDDKVVSSDVAKAREHVGRLYGGGIG
jgi:hypothetical protein